MDPPAGRAWNLDDRYSREAYQFLLDALDYMMKSTGREGMDEAARHVSGQDLLDGMREFALTLFGPLTAQVWRSWGVHSTLDWGRIVFVLVDAKLLRRQETDTIEDFRDGYDFDQAFKGSYRTVLPPEFEARPTPDQE